MLTPRDFVRIVFVLACMCPAAVTALTPLEEAAFQRIQKREVFEYARAKEQEWLTAVKPGRQRLFYDESAWEAQARRINDFTGQGALLREALFEAADRIVATPLPVYTAPAAGMRDAEGWQRGYGDMLVTLAVAAKLRPKDAYLEALRARVLAGCRFDTWGREGNGGVSHNMDLAAGHMARGIALAYDWHRKLFLPEDAEVVRSVFKTRMNDMMRGLYGEIFWASWYTQNHNHVSVAGLGLAGAAFLGEIPEACQWLAAADLNFKRVAAAMYEDGGIYEGVPYWGYGRAAILQYIEGTHAITEAGRFYDMPFLRNSAEFRLGCSTPGLGGVLLWGDSRGRDVSGPQHVLHRLAAQYRDGRAQWLASEIPAAPQGAADAVAWSVLWYDLTVEMHAPRKLDYHSWSWDVVTSRSGWGDGDYMLSLKAGYNVNHHTKPDAGSLALSIGSQWLLMAPGYGNDLGNPGFFDQQGQRWRFFSNVTESHSTLLINGATQRLDKEAVGVIDRQVQSPSLILVEVDLKKAYVAGPEAIRRRMLHRRGDYALVLDSVHSAKPVTVEWLAQVPPVARIMDEGRVVEVLGRAGALSLRVLGGGPFVERVPLAPVKDVFPEWMKTLSSKDHGEEIFMAVLMQPAYGRTPASPLKAEIRREDGTRRITITGEGWVDDSWTNDTVGGATVSGDFEAKAELASVRRRGGAIDSWVVAGAVRVTDGLIGLESATGFEVAMERVSPTVAVLSFGGAFSGRVLLPAGMRLVAEAGGGPVDVSGEARLPKGRYGILAATSGERLDVAVRTLEDRFGPTEAPEEAKVMEPEPRPSLDVSVNTPWEAESDVRDEAGSTKVVERGEASGGRVLVNFGSKSSADQISWRVDVPMDGLYQLVMHYAIGQPKVEFAVTVNGLAQGRDALRAFVTGDKGWGREQYWTLSSFDWRESVVAGDSGRPLVLSLAKGTNEIGLRHPSAGINLDALRLVGSGN